MFSGVFQKTCRFRLLPLCEVHAVEEFLAAPCERALLVYLLVQADESHVELPVLSVPSRHNSFRGNNSGTPSVAEVEELNELLGVVTELL